jgi:hypothetical protein
MCSYRDGGSAFLAIDLRLRIRVLEEAVTPVDPAMFDSRFLLNGAEQLAPCLHVPE